MLVSQFEPEDARPPPDASARERTAWLMVAVPFVLVVAVWWTTSTTITLVNSLWLSDLGFDFPFFLGTTGNGVAGLLAFALTRLPWLRQPPLPWRVFVRVALPVGVLTALDIGLSNWSLVYASVSFHTMIKATAPAFVLLFGWLLGLERCSASTCVAIGLIVGGLALSSCDQVDFSIGWDGVAGLALGLASSLLSGLRWALTQLLLHGGAPSSSAASSSSSSSSSATAPQQQPHGQQQQQQQQQQGPQGPRASRTSDLGAPGAVLARHAWHARREARRARRAASAHASAAWGKAAAGVDRCVGGMVGELSACSAAAASPPLHGNAHAPPSPPPSPPLHHAADDGAAHAVEADEAGGCDPRPHAAKGGDGDLGREPAGGANAHAAAPSGALAAGRSYHPLATMLYTSPVTAATSALCALLGERGVVSSPYFGSAEYAGQLLGFLFGVALLVFVLILAEFWLVRLTSSLSFSVLAIAKEILTVGAAALFLGDSMSASDVGGFAVCILGVALYQCSKHPDARARLRRCYTRCCGCAGPPWGRLIAEPDDSTE